MNVDLGDSLRNYKTKFELVYDLLKQAIVNGKLQPGSELVTSKLAEEMGISRMPIRESLKKLEAEGLVIVIPHKGAIVTPISRKDIDEVLTIRSNLESLAAKLVCPLLDETDIELLKEKLAEMKNSFKNQNFVAMGILNREFHDLIYDRCPNELLRHYINELWNRSFRLRVLFVICKSRTVDSIKEHEEIIAALQNKDEILTEKLMRQHVLNAQQAFMEKLED